MDKITIRECSVGDADAICLLNKNEMGYDYPLEATRNKLRMLLSKPENKIFVAETGGRGVGYVHANDYDVIYAPHFKDIMGIAVSGDFRKMGIGRTLLSATEKWAKETGACGIRLVSWEKRTGAHEFYRRCGYTERKKQLNFNKLF